MKGYAVESGYMGYVNGEYMLFASETDYAMFHLPTVCSFTTNNNALSFDIYLTSFPKQDVRYYELFLLLPWQTYLLPTTESSFLHRII